MKVIMAPDWRAGNPYQSLLAGALAGAGVDLQFLSHYRRGLPLRRGLEGFSCDLFHLHWPEAYYDRREDAWGVLREWRFPLDLKLATRHLPCVATAHNLYPHNRRGSAQVRRNSAAFYRNAARIITHSPSTAGVLASEFGIDPGKCVFIPHGDIAEKMRPLMNKQQARAALGRQSGRICLMFGAVEPYKGLEEVIDFWNHCRPDADLAIAGRAVTPEYAGQIRARASGNPRISCHLEWLAEEKLLLWLAACDVVIFNYRSILVSGAALMARQLGLPVLLPEKLNTVDLGEPAAGVFRFRALDETFLPVLGEALSAGRGTDETWLAAHSWENIAARTLDVYESALATQSA